MKSLKNDEADEYIPLSIYFTILQILFYFSFILLGCFFNEFLATQIAVLNIPLSFAMGLAVILLGTFLTVIYVIVVNRNEES
ncbi:DUF485 domain-containing protein [Acinetobacter qingfengensis]|uniref:Uncharacterized protein n=1 Tax=Acinetobacter qingfengensis TaxID=1262585 RepID=A0A1E7R3L5_9GAMM|nr:DUF485 domain-containing protein [Acinetobacter qingfengensis]KAA8735588.1 DUF485 domain-containing protein [Acinetobacter qingfengensis]OEY93872.1 hypothetical protein BJI46_13860 [Acinetobacter qingfengensis]